MAKSNSGMWRKVSVKIWADDNFRSLSSDAQLVYFFVITNRNSTSIGAMEATLEGMAAALRLSGSDDREANYMLFLNAINETFKLGMLQFSDRDMVIIIPNHFKHNPPESPNVVVGMMRVLKTLPASELIDDQILRLIQYFEDRKDEYGSSFIQPFLKHSELLSPALIERLPDPYRKGSPNPFLNPSKGVPDTLPLTPTQRVPGGVKEPLGEPMGEPLGDSEAVSSNRSSNYTAGSSSTTGLPNDIPPLASLSLIPSSELTKIPKEPTVRGAQAFHGMTDQDIIVWIVWLEDEMRGDRKNLKRFKKLFKSWTTRLNPLWTTEQGRSMLLDSFADIWNSKNANESKGTGAMANEAATLNKRITEFKASTS